MYDCVAKKSIVPDACLTGHVLCNVLFVRGLLHFKKKSYCSVIVKTGWVIAGLAIVNEKHAMW